MKAQHVLLIAVGLLFSVPAAAQQNSETDLDAAIHRARTIANAISQSSDVPGMGFAVGLNGHLVWEEGFGVADLEQGTPATPLTRYRVGSVSKSFTGAALGVLMQSGRLDLDAEVQSYVDFPEKRWPVTTRQAAGHIAGIRHYRDDEFLSDVWYPTVDSGLTIFEDDTLLFEPGSRYAYSSYGFNLVSAVVEGASDENFLHFIQRAVFDPAGMTHTAADVNKDIIPFRTSFYTREDDDWVNAPYVDNSYKWAGGGFLSTPSDMVRFGMSLLDGSILQQETVDQLWRPQQLNSGDSTSYGVGFGTGQGFDGRRTVGHSGGSVGGNAHLLIFPEEGLVLASAANATAPIHYSELWAMAQGFLVDRTERSQPILSAAAGEWSCTLDATGEEGSLRLAIPDSTRRAWAESDGRFLRTVDHHTSDGRASMTLVSETGEVRSIEISPEGDQLAGRLDRRAMACVRE